MFGVRARARFPDNEDLLNLLEKVRKSPPSLIYSYYMETFITMLPWIQIVLSVLLIVAILLQQSSAGVGGAFGGSDSGGFHHTRRGFEKILFQSTVLLAILFGLSAFVSLVL
jgi:preprotein translocase subunit SecG